MGINQKALTISGVNYDITFGLSGSFLFPALLFIQEAVQLWRAVTRMDPPSWRLHLWRGRWLFDLHVGAVLRR